MLHRLLFVSMATVGLLPAAEITVNGDIITRGDLERTRKQMEAGLRQQGAAGQRLTEAMQDGEKNILRERIDSLLLLSKAKELNLNVDTEVSKQFAEIRSE